MPYYCSLVPDAGEAFAAKTYEILNCRAIDGEDREVHSRRTVMMRYLIHIIDWNVVGVERYARPGRIFYSKYGLVTDKAAHLMGCCYYLVWRSQKSCPIFAIPRKYVVSIEKRICVEIGA